MSIKMFFLKKFKPRSPGTRNKIVCINFDFLKNQKHFFFFKARCQISGRNNKGIITVRHRSSVSKRKKIIWIDYLRTKFIVMSVLLGIFKQKRNMCFFGLTKSSGGAYSYIPVPHGLIIGQFIEESTFLSKSFDLSIGSLCFFLAPHITFKFFNLCSFFKKKSVYAKAAGVFCLFILKNLEKNILKITLPSKKFKYLNLDWYATTGRASNLHAYRLRTGIAGVNRYEGKRPTVRGVAMNAVDHPNGGRTKTNKPEKTPWGKTAKHSK